MNMKLKSIAAAAVLAVSAGAHADETFELGTVNGTLPVGNTVFSGSFTDTYNFTVSSLSSVTAIVLNTSYTIESSAISLGRIGLIAASLDGVPLTLSIANTSIAPGIDMTVQKLFTFTGVPMGGLNTHTLTIGGVADAPSAAYTGSISVTAVPEPETYALMLAGLGVVGLLARRRRSV